MSWRLRLITIAWHCPDCGLEGEIPLPGCVRNFHELTSRERALVSAEVSERHQQAHFRQSRGQAKPCLTHPIWTL